jgi:hypothetical protein
MHLFERYVGVDYSGATTAESSLKEIRVYAATAAADPQQVLPPSSPRKYWSRCELAKWLLEQLSGEAPHHCWDRSRTFISLTYFKRHGFPLDWPRFLDDFQLSRCFGKKSSLGSSKLSRPPKPRSGTAASSRDTKSSCQRNHKCEPPARKNRTRHQISLFNPESGRIHPIIRAGPTAKTLSQWDLAGAGRGANATGAYNQQLTRARTVL